MLFAARPDLFSLKNPVPLKVGIHSDLVAAYPGIKPWRLGEVLRWLVNRRAYLTKCFPGAVRFGLDGPSGTITEQQAQHAKDRFAERNSKARDPWIVEGETA